MTDASPYLVMIGVNDLPRVWNRIEPLLSKACADSNGEFTIPHILHEMGIDTGVERWRLMAIIRNGDPQAAMVVCVSQVGEARVLDCILASGEHAKEWPLVDEEFDAFAREFGCSRVRIPRARKGWARALPHWKITAYVMEREV